MEIGDKIIIKNDDIYDEYEEWIRRNSPEYAPKWKGFVCPTVGADYTIVAKAPHGYFYPEQDLILYAIKGDDGIFIVDEEILKEKGELV